MQGGLATRAREDKYSVAEIHGRIKLNRIALSGGILLLILACIASVIDEAMNGKGQDGTIVDMVAGLLLLISVVLMFFGGINLRAYTLALPRAVLRENELAQAAERETLEANLRSCRYKVRSLMPVRDEPEPTSLRERVNFRVHARRGPVTLMEHVTVPYSQVQIAFSPPDVTLHAPLEHIVLGCKLYRGIPFPGDLTVSFPDATVSASGYVKSFGHRAVLHSDAYPYLPEWKDEHLRAVEKGYRWQVPLSAALD